MQMYMTARSGKGFYKPTPSEAGSFKSYSTFGASAKGWLHGEQG